MDRKTNNSLHVTGVTQLYEMGAPEKLIQERTSHRSLEALRAYERTCFYQHQVVSKLLLTSTNTHYMQEIKRVQTDLAGPPTQQHVTGPSKFPLLDLHSRICMVAQSTTPASSSITEVTHQLVVDHNTVVNN